MKQLKHFLIISYCILEYNSYCPQSVVASLIETTHRYKSHIQIETEQSEAEVNAKKYNNFFAYGPS